MASILERQNTFSEDSNDREHDMIRLMVQNWALDELVPETQRRYRNELRKGTWELEKLRGDCTQKIEALFGDNPKKEVDEAWSDEVKKANAQRWDDEVKKANARRWQLMASLNDLIFQFQYHFTTIQESWNDQEIEKYHLVDLPTMLGQYFFKSSFELGTRTDRAPRAAISGSFKKLMTTDFKVAATDELDQLDKQVAYIASSLVEWRAAEMTKSPPRRNEHADEHTDDDDGDDGDNDGIIGMSDVDDKEDKEQSQNGEGEAMSWETFNDMRIACFILAMSLMERHHASVRGVQHVVPQQDILYNRPTGQYWYYLCERENVDFVRGGFWTALELSGTLGRPHDVIIHNAVASESSIYLNNQEYGEWREKWPGEWQQTLPDLRKGYYLIEGSNCAYVPNQGTMVQVSDAMWDQLRELIFAAYPNLAEELRARASTLLSRGGQPLEKLQEKWQMKLRQFSRDQSAGFQKYINHFRLSDQSALDRRNQLALALDYLDFLCRIATCAPYVFLRDFRTAEPIKHKGIHHIFWVLQQLALFDIQGVDGTETTQQERLETHEKVSGRMQALLATLMKQAVHDSGAASFSDSLLWAYEPLIWTAAQFLGYLNPMTIPVKWKSSWTLVEDGWTRDGETPPTSNDLLSLILTAPPPQAVEITRSTQVATMLLVAALESNAIDFLKDMLKLCNEHVHFDEIWKERLVAMFKDTKSKAFQCFRVLIAHADQRVVVAVPVAPSLVDEFKDPTQGDIAPPPILTRALQLFAEAHPNQATSTTRASDATVRRADTAGGTPTVYVGPVETSSQQSQQSQQSY